MNLKRPRDDGEAMVLAIKHPLRRQVLAVLVAEGRGAPKPLSDRLNDTLQVVSWHCRALEFYGAAILSDTKPVRGSRQHFYEPTELGRKAVALAKATGMLDGDS